MQTTETAPPKGFRKSIPTVLKLEIVIQQAGRCASCSEPLGSLDNTEFDHVPALQLRCWDVEAKDTFPPANSKEHLKALHTDCHRAKTTGRRGESKLSMGRGDAQEIAKLRRIEKKQEDYRRQLLSKEDDEGQDKPSKKYIWPKRSFPKRSEDETNAQRRRKGGQGNS